MNEPTMPLQVFLDGKVVFNGELLPNGPGLTLCSAPGDLDFLSYEADTELVEAKIPMEIHRNDQIIGDGELYHSGDYYCLCPTDQSLDLMDCEGVAQLFLEKFGQIAKLEITNGH